MRSALHLLTLAFIVPALGCGPDESPDAPSDGQADSARAPMADVMDWNADLSFADLEAKYCKMAASAFVFYRGTNHLYWKDFASDPRLSEFGSESTRTWLQGDLHAYNYGAYDNDEGKVVFSLNDFDEAIIADYQLDVWRMAASIVLIARENDNLSADRLADTIDAFSRGYLDGMGDFRGNDDENDLVFTAGEFQQPLKGFLEDVRDDNSRRKALEKWTVVDGTDRHFDLSLERLAAVDATRDVAIRVAMEGYGRSLTGGLTFDPDYFKVKSVARRLLAGTGSLGTPRFYVLIEGESTDTDDDRILDFKRQSEPTALRYLTDKDRLDYADSFASHAERHALGYKALVVETDDHLGWTSISGEPFSVRERSVYKESLAADEELKEFEDYENSARMWGRVLATTHARADNDFDAALIPTSVEEQITDATNRKKSAFRQQVRTIAQEYADLVETDWQLFLAELAPVNCPAP